MRPRSIIAGTAVLAFLSASPASAQSFDGPFVGVQAGGQKADIRNLDTALGTRSLEADRSSFTGGLFTGYDRQIAPGIVVGAEAGFDLAGDDKASAQSAAGLVAIDPKWSLDVTGRAGYLLDPATLAYVRGGYTNARIDVSGTTVLSESEYRDAWTLGAGLERQILKKISARLEYRFSDLSEGEGTFDRHRLLAGIAYRF
ncbi:MAG TPA: porin family protein [Allosphingosinicella sp.]